ncbi:lysine 2,3-aminomutase (plasmid) [Legionella adelaidensis]|uniref:L-lysine 2,3-aminomutase n=1 Tax=Legionella adelaidensis TaxID=45056 RepID=A0A0W0R1Q4_9GAMM|nr:EF-P beta-lysylation protein EpmB [Legionella adelaidensis]KTC64889.1 lysine 2,3-aminomutase [Legionella adelaidensis]VEH82940.1 lysine 2,3-aminomutase [Legionella adelaidensis]
MRDSNLSWQKILGDGFNSSSELLQFLNLPINNLLAVEKVFKTRVPRRFASLMEQGNPNDPLLLQVLAQEKELEKNPAYVRDPLGESSVNQVPGLLHKYKGRVLLTITNVCAVNCRYCFRRHFPYQSNNPGKNGWPSAIDYIRKDDSIEEVIFSGGDPLLASDAILAYLFEQIITIKHVKTIRFHTRIPIVLPERITSSFLQLLKKLPLKKVMVIHSNHANELDTYVEESCLALKNVGCHLLNQSVLLRGVNDSAHVLAKLSKRLFDCQVLPYYLHLLDKVDGAGHFDLPKEEAKMIYEELQTLLPGYLVPRLACEEAGKSHKTLI